MAEQGKCPIWQTRAKINSLDYDEILHVYSPRAGGWYVVRKPIVGPVSRVLGPAYGNEIKLSLSLWIWEENIRQNINASTPYTKCPEINSASIKIAQQSQIPSDDDRVENVRRHLEHYRKDIQGMKQLTEKDDHFLFLQAATFDLNGKDLGEILRGGGLSFLL